MVKEVISGHPIQAFPIHKDVFIGVATNTPVANKIVNIAEDCDVTFHYQEGDVVLTNVVAPYAFAVSYDCTGVTSTGSIWIG